MKIVRAAKDNINRVVQVFKLVRSSGSSGTGLPVGGTVGQFLQKSGTANFIAQWFTLTMDFFGLSNVTDGAKGTGFTDLGVIPDNQNFDAGVSDNAATITADRTITLSGFTPFTQRKVVRFTGSGGPWIVTVPIGWEVESGSKEDLSSIEDGQVLDAIFKSYDSGSNGTIVVKEVSA